MKPATSWKTSALGILTIALALANAAYNYLNSGDLPNFATLGATLFAGWGLLHAKDSNVTNAPLPSIATTVRIFIAVLIPIGFVLALAACTTAQRDAAYSNIQLAQADPRVQKAERVAGAILQDFILAWAQSKANGTAVNSSWVMTTGLHSLADVVPLMSNSAAAEKIASTAQAFSDDPSTKPVADKLAAAYLKADPQTPAQKAATLAALAKGAQNGITNATNALP